MSEYIIQKGDTLSALAKNRSCTVEELCKANNITDPDKIQAGQILIFPEKDDNVTKNEYTPDKKDPISEIKEYKIKKGDTLSDIAQKYGCTIKELCAANNITDPDKIQIGQTLIIPIKAKKTQETDKTNKLNTANKAETETHEIKKGDTLSDIAQKYGCTVEELCKANNITEPDKIQIGQTLLIPIKPKEPNLKKEISETNKSTNTKTEHDIKKNEGEIPTTYIAPEGKATIGYGHQLTNVPPFLQKIHEMKASVEVKKQLLEKALSDPNNRAQLKECLKTNIKNAIKNTGLTNVSPEINDNLNLTQEQMDVLFESDNKIVVTALKKRLGADVYENLSQNQKEALIDLFYNIGPNKTKKNGSEYNLIQLIKENKLPEAQQEFDFFRDEKGKLHGGLIKRNYQRMLKWNNGVLTDEAKQKLITAYNKCYGKNVKSLKEIQNWLDGKV